ncbi:glutamate--tRNA ligase [Aureimonas populi]|uniref:Glutamate--tRNA ligase n=1 Tax=Aureimonas populi TaxID=1701758 RepID=A0ABW5CQH7_9HYPH|nr:glutamate--tRNA ligase [Aureimonas populi]
MTPLLRFAPSPTGYLHIGNLRPALFNWLFAARHGGRFVLRFDDTDTERSREEYVRAIVEDLAWIGIHPHETARQSERIALYERAARVLREKGLLYACYETPDELDRRRKRAAARGLPPIYGRDALRLTQGERAELEAAGRRPYWRFLLPNFDSDPFQTRRSEVVWDDMIRGRQTVDLASLSDPVLVREDGSFLYTLPSLVDDGEMGVTHVIRGEDHVTNTGVQISIAEALGYARPIFGHHNLLTTIDGEGLSKRSGALSLRTLREEGAEPMAVASLAVLTGAAGAVEAVPDLAALAERVDFSAISASSARFDPAELWRLNAELVHALPYEAVEGQLRAMGAPESRARAFWDAVRGNCGRVADAALWKAVVFDEPQPAARAPQDEDFLRTAAGYLPDEPWDRATWKLWTDALKEASGRKGKALFLPLRRALTGLEHGPELADLLPLIGRGEVLRRLG